MIMTIDVQDNFAKKILDFIKQFEVVRILQKENYYIDELGDLIEVREDGEFVVPTKEDLQALQSLKDEEFISLEELKKELDV